MKSKLSTFWRRMANGEDRGFAASILKLILSPVSFLYGCIQRLRSLAYRTGILCTRRLPRPVVSVGNITVGGTGKTPVTAWLAGHLIEQGYRVAALSRGYGGSQEGEVAIVSDGSQMLLSAAECGDEPYLLASTVPGLMVVIGSDRYAAGLLAMERLNPDLFLLDDGFQHIRLHRDMNILLLDAKRPLGNGWTLPAGLLREPYSAARRADWIIHTRCDNKAEILPGLEGIPRVFTRHELAGLVSMEGGGLQPLTQLKGRSVVAFAGIAEPEPFFHDLAACEARLVRTIALQDHVDYDEALLESITSTAADFFVTTEKDAVKLQGLLRSDQKHILAARLKLSVEGGDPLLEDLCNLLQKMRPLWHDANQNSPGATS